jgi:hypothetical protein
LSFGAEIQSFDRVQNNMFYTTLTEVIMSKQNVLGAKQKVMNDKPMLKKRFKT